MNNLSLEDKEALLERLKGDLSTIDPKDIATAFAIIKVMIQPRILGRQIETISRELAEFEWNKHDRVGITSSAIVKNLYIEKRWSDFCTQAKDILGINVETPVSYTEEVDDYRRSM